MTKKIRKAGVIGAGVMGATIAAHLSNVGIETLLLDMLPKDLLEADKKKGLTEESSAFRNKYALNGVDGALKSKPASFFIPENAKHIAIGNMTDNLESLSNVDWIIEVVPEKLDIKQSVFEKIETVMQSDTIVTSNTSGLSAAAMCEGRSERFRTHFAITHFFNPPRYMKLLEIVPGADMPQETVDFLAETCRRVLGKGVVFAKDTPNFIANRIGIHNLLSVVKTMMALGLSVEFADSLTGSIIGYAKSASFRTADLVGIDTVFHVAENVYNGALEDEERDQFKVPGFIRQMIGKNLLGEKAKQGFYKKTEGSEGKRIILSLNCNTLEYVPQEKIKSASVEAARLVSGTARKIRSLYYAADIAGKFTFKHLSDMLIYCANRIPEIADDIVTVDNAMKWGFGRKLGPFETWDAIGVEASVKKMKAAGYDIPLWIKEMLEKGNQTFYIRRTGTLLYYDIITKEYKEVVAEPGIIFLPALKERKKEVLANPGASLIDLGDGVACLEFHTKMNTFGDDIINMVRTGADRVKRDFDGLVIANHADHFSAGANLALVLFMAQEEEWDDLDWSVRALQDALMKLKYLDKPVVAAPVGMALGGGCEICLAADRVRYAAETYMGLVEVGVGVIPAGGGSKELLIRNTEHLFEVEKGGVYPKQIEFMPFVARAFETIAMAKVSTSGPEAIKLGYLRPIDRMTVNRDYLIEDAKRTILAMNLEGYIPPPGSIQEIRVAGENTLAMIKLALWTLHEQDFITAHDVTVGTKVGTVLCGGNVVENTKVTEQYLLDLEREAFLSLCGNPKTQARMQHMLATGKPLRN